VNFAFTKQLLIDWCLTSSEQFFSYIQDDPTELDIYVFIKIPQYHMLFHLILCLVSHPPGVPEFTPFVSVVRVAQSFV
jgi:hypothetical protein